MQGTLDPGIYINIFQVRVPDDKCQVLIIRRNELSNLHDLRQQLENKNKQVWVYADEDTVYGYGRDASILTEYRFQESTIRLVEKPKLTTHVIIEGLVKKLKEDGYEAIPSKGRWQMYHPDQCDSVADGKVRVYRGYDLRSLFWRDPTTNHLTFGLIVDIF